VKKKRESNSESLSQVFEQLRAQYGWESKWLEAELRQKWDEYLGRELALATSKLNLKEEVLYAFINGSVPRSEIFNRRSALKEYLNAELPSAKIRDIRLI